MHFDIKNLTFGYNGDTVLNNVSFTVEQGECAAIIGGNGAGKSTLMKLILNELTPEQGEILIDGVSTAAYRQWWKIGYVPQNCFTLMDRFPASVEEVVFSGMYHRLGLLKFFSSQYRKTVEELLDAVGLLPFAKSPVNKLSGGQQQRTLIARALASEPESLLLDEPTSGIDPTAANELFTLLDNIRQKRQLTVLMITHDHQRACDWFNSIYCLEDGSVVKLDAHQLQEEIQSRHKHPGAHYHGERLGHHTDCLCEQCHLNHKEGGHESS